MDMVNRVFMELMLGGDADGRGFQYPIPTYNLTKDFDWDSPNAQLLFEMTAKYGTPYFQNFINSDLDPGDVRSMCCRLQLDKRELRKRGGGLFGSDELTGSIGVVTLNMPRLGYLAQGKGEFYRRLDHLMDLAAESLSHQAQGLLRLLEGGLFPYTRRYLKNFDSHFNTIGLVGMNECALNFIGKSIAEPEGKAFAEEVLDHMRKRMAGLPGGYGRALQPGGHARGKHLVPPGQARQDPVSGDHNRGHGRAVLYEFHPAARRLYRGSVRRPGPPGIPAEPLYRRHGIPYVPGRGRGRLARAARPGARGSQPLPHTLLHGVANLLGVPVHGYISGEHFNCPKCKAEKEARIREEIAILEKELAGS
jgi:ribonucleoside-triphosphate reductase (formate)